MKYVYTNNWNLIFFWYIFKCIDTLYSNDLELTHTQVLPLNIVAFNEIMWELKDSLVNIYLNISKFNARSDKTLELVILMFNNTLVAITWALKACNWNYWIKTLKLELLEDNELIVWNLHQ